MSKSKQATIKPISIRPSGRAKLHGPQRPNKTWANKSSKTANKAATKPVNSGSLKISNWLDVPNGQRPGDTIRALLLRKMRRGVNYTTPALEEELECPHGKPGDAILNQLHKLADEGIVKRWPKKSGVRSWSLADNGNNEARTFVKKAEPDKDKRTKQNASRKTSQVAKAAVTPLTPRSIDYDGGPAARRQSTTYRLLRDTAKARAVKTLHNFECQICGETLVLQDGTRYAEAHHIQPLGRPHCGPDKPANILCLCPNHHAALDYAALEISIEELRPATGHPIGEEFVSYHNALVSQRRARPDEVPK